MDVTYIITQLIDSSKVVNLSAFLGRNEKIVTILARNHEDKRLPSNL
jgi:hypothetical protein